jgi:hypothetical protein
MFRIDEPKGLFGDGLNENDASFGSRESHGWAGEPQPRGRWLVVLAIILSAIAVLTVTAALLQG